MNNTIRRVPTCLFLVLITLILSNCSSGNSPALGEAVLSSPTATPIITDNPTDVTQTPDTISCSDDSMCDATQKCVEGFCRKKHTQIDYQKALGLFTLNKTCDVGQHECSESEYCQSNHPNSKLGTCQKKKELNALCNSDFECLSNTCIQDHNEKICSDNYNNPKVDSKSTPFSSKSYYLSDQSEKFYSKYTDYSTWDSVNPNFESVHNTCTDYKNNPTNAIVALQINSDKNGVKGIEIVCQDINGTITNHSNLEAVKTIYGNGGAPKDYFLADAGTLLTGFWVKDANAGGAVIELQPYLTKIETLKPLVTSESISPVSWGPGDGSIEAFDLKCKPGYAMVSVGAREYLGYYRSLEIECRKIKISIKNGYSEDKK